MITDTNDIRITADTFIDEDGSRLVAIRDVIASINRTRPIRESGKWIVHEYAEECEGRLIPNYECSVCHSWFRDHRKFCGDCGTEMEDL